MFNDADARRELLISVRSLNWMLRDSLSPICNKHGLTIPQYFVLAILSKNPPLTMTDICKKMNIQRTNISPLYKGMEKDGLVERTRNDVDRRSFWITITDNGQSLLDEIDVELNEALDKYADQFPEDDFEEAYDGIHKLYKIVDAVEFEG